tara:strand:+ start:601 stop:753 length:153 start_codon:yes stop_codon:yes gene_type:complete
MLWTAFFLAAAAFSFGLVLASIIVICFFSIAIIFASWEATLVWAVAVALA